MDPQPTSPVSEKFNCLKSATPTVAQLHPVPPLPGIALVASCYRRVPVFPTPLQAVSFPAQTSIRQ